MSRTVTRHIGVVIHRVPEMVYSLASDPDLLPRWAAGLAAGPVRHEGGALVVDSPMGEVRVRFVGRNGLGVLDHEVELPDGTLVHNPLRVLPHPDGAEVVFTLRTGAADMDGDDDVHDADAAAADDEARRDAEAVAADLKRLKALAESAPAESTSLHAGRTPPEPVPGVRLATPADADALGRMLYEFNAEFGVKTPGAHAAATHFGRMLAVDDVVVVVATSSGTSRPDASPAGTSAPRLAPGGSTAGFALVTFRPSCYYDAPVAQLDELYVRSDLRGHGIGTAMLALATDEMRARGCPECLINVESDDAGVRRFYERLGWSHLDPDSGAPMLCYLRAL